MDTIKYAVVCVDDDPFILQMLAFQLTKVVNQKHTLIEYFTDPSEAFINIDALVEEKIDIIFIIVDYQMPEMTGAQLIRAIKSKHPGLKCIMLSGQANPISVEELLKDEMLVSFIAKPWNEEVLFQAIQPIIESLEA
jgi:CheY-like chemotaxis protein